MLSARAAALLAALTIRIGFQPLAEAAERELIPWRERWNNIEIPETWNVGCMSLLLDANKAYCKKIERGEVHIMGAPNSLLKAEDEALFQALVSYKMLENNLDTTLKATIGWTPEKASVPIGAITFCSSCQYPRSVTIMGPEGKCGLCLATFSDDDDERETYINAHVHKEDTEGTLASWVECQVRTCRAQYVVYRTECLNVRPKCHFCQENQVAPVVECTKCLNRVVWPEQYRPKDLDSTNFHCYACTAGRPTTL